MERWGRGSEDGQVRVRRGGEVGERMERWGRGWEDGQVRVRVGRLHAMFLTVINCVA